MRILVCECKQEISSFNPSRGSYEDFAIARGEEMLFYHRQVHSEVGGALSVLERDPEVEVVPGYSARAITSGGTLADSAFSQISAEFLEQVRSAGAIDGVYFALHGALAAESQHDVEGYLLAEARKILGDRVPVAISLDLHGVLTDWMLENCDVAAVYQTYPHVDFFETGAKAARLLLKLVRNQIRPIMVRVPVPMLVRGDELITETGLFGRMIRKAQSAESSPGGLSAGIFIGNPFTDVPELCSNAFVVTDGDAESGAREAMEIARDLWEARAKLQSTLTSLSKSVSLAAEAKGRVVLTDAADATSSGASGDSNAILRALVEAGFPRSTLAPIVDAPAVEKAFQAGVGGTVQVKIGGSIDPARFTPLPWTAKVVMLSDGQFRSESHGEQWNAGRTAVLKSANYTLVTTSRAVSLYDRSLFLAHGQDPKQFDAVVVKSPHCQHQFFNDGAELVLNVDAPGSSSANLKSLGHQRCRPIYPVDDDVVWTPQARIFAGKHRGIPG